MIPVKLTRVENGSALRTDSVVGTTPYLPEVGRPFVIVGPSLSRPDDDEAERVVTTSTVQEILDHGKFRTRNSVYHLELL